MRVLLAERWGNRPEVIAFDTRGRGAASMYDRSALLLIGDKVVTAPPAADAFPHQLDLGQAWFEHTGLPFVFAVWMCRAGSKLGRFPKLLAERRQTNRGRIDQIVARHAPAHHWPADLAQRYLSEWLRYEVGATELAAIERFHNSAYRLGLIPALRPLVRYSDQPQTKTAP
jgi:chorismate dehydratase